MHLWAYHASVGLLMFGFAILVLHSMMTSSTYRNHGCGQTAQ